MYYDSIRQYFAANPAATWRDYYAHVKASGNSLFDTPQAQQSMREDAAEVIARATDGSI